MQRSPLEARLLGALVLAATCSACASNPVTGQRQFTLTSEKREIATGERHYPTAIAEEGGEFSIDPKLPAYIDSVGQRVAAAGPRPNLPYEFTVIDSSKPMAFVLPGGKIAITRGLLVMLENEGQLAAVLAHQVVHAAAKHPARRLEHDIMKRTAIAIVAIGATVFGIPAFPALVMAHRSESTSQMLVHLQYDEDEEILADRHAMEGLRKAGYSPGHTVDALQVLTIRELETHPTKVKGSIFESHPLSRKRASAARLRAWKLEEEEQARREEGEIPSGEKPDEKFAERTAWVRGIQHAYDAYESGRAAYFEADYDRALHLAQHASDALPREPRFHELAGHIWMQKGNYEDAFTSYDRVLALRPSDSEAWARRGLARKALGDPEGAYVDFRISLSLAPNAIAERELAVWHWEGEPGTEAEDTGAEDREIVESVLPPRPEAEGGSESSELE